MPNVQLPNVQRPDVQRPGGQRPDLQTPSLQRPAPGTNLPHLGGSRPGLGGVGTKPTLPVERPSLPPGSLTRPGSPNLPSIGKIPPNRLPEGIERPTTLPGDLTRPITRPGDLTRPSPLPGDTTRPNTPIRPIPERPSTRPGDVTRPIPPNRPNVNRPQPLPEIIQRPSPGFPSRPGHGGGHIDHGRPIIGGSRPNINIGQIGNNQSNINIGQLNINNTIFNQYVNRPSWDFDPGFSRPSWGLGGSTWTQHWHYNCIHRHYHWYNGCWHGYWNSSWYTPVTWYTVGWGLNSWTRTWGYTYYNPYYASPLVTRTISYDYSQPVVINNHVSVDSQGNPHQSPAESAQQLALNAFDDGLAKFKRGEYVQALSVFNVALSALPQDPVVHELLALTLFAVGNYEAAAASLNSLLLSAPGMDWTTMSSLYGRLSDYTAQLRKLETYVRANPDNAAAHFVLAYHYLVHDSKQQAIDALRVVVQSEPKDLTARRMLDALDPPAASTDDYEELQLPVGDDDVSLQTDLVGEWQAKSENATITLSINEQAQFIWKANDPIQEPLELSGTLSADSGGIELITLNQGTLAGLVVSEGANAWIFKIAGSPKSDPGLKFERVK
ncbi:MAG TPA: tetratricopeptide repeat protein [Pirellulaceae bacterium]|nr:tetratricopeptide repeat protein [Pirellulaceae bacterium]HMO92882.1 tetratricopeptide repeat protein [Pirellulaceae bacterium]HMP69161.1 tetratricopeptide repeat protein [Pirellulaceae bacterium]